MVTLAQVKAHLRVDGDHEDEHLAHLIKVAKASIENDLRRSFEGEEVPPPVQHAALLLIGHWYAHREEIVMGATVATLPVAARHLLSPYRRLVT